MSAKYTNPKNPTEYIVIVCSKSSFGVKSIVHHTPLGFLDKSWFTTFVPNLDRYAESYFNAVKNIPHSVQGEHRDRIVRGHFSKNINEKIDADFPHGLSLVQIKAINAFFHKYLPDVEGICSTCFKLTLPRSGAGIRWFAENNSKCEVRLSEPKPFGYSSQQKLYLTHNYRVEKKLLHIKWNGLITQNPILSEVLKDPDTHIPWEYYDYEHIVNKLPSYYDNKIMVCQCKRG